MSSDFFARLRSRQRRIAAIAILLTSLLPTRFATAGAFDRAIERVMPRSIKLYGLAAGKQAGYGTGVLVSSDGRVITVLSVLLEARTVRAIDAKGRHCEADVLYRDSKRQLALLQLKQPGSNVTARNATDITDLPYFDLTVSTELAPGDWVLAAGNAFKVAEGAEPMSLAHGVFSTRTHLDARRRVKDFPYRGEVLVIDAITSNPGGPGSALVNIDGGFLGIVGRFVTSNLTHTHFNYAIPRDVLVDFYHEATDPEARAQALAARIAGEKGKPLDLGLRLARVGYQQVLPFVERVTRGSLAEQSGVRKDDLILSLNNRRISSVDEYDNLVKTIEADETIHLVVRRGRRIVALEIQRENDE